MLTNKENLKNLYKDISQKNKILNMDKKMKKLLKKYQEIAESLE